MSPVTLRLTTLDPIVARDGRPFGVGQGRRMRSLGWPLPSMIAGAFRTTLVKASPGQTFEGDVPRRLTEIGVAGAFPVVEGTDELCLPAPADCVWEKDNGAIHRVTPSLDFKEGEGVDWPDTCAKQLRPVQLLEEVEDFKPAQPPDWWPLSKYVEWLKDDTDNRPSSWFGGSFLAAPHIEVRDHVCLDAATGAADEGLLFSTVGLQIAWMPKHFSAEIGRTIEERPFREKYAEVSLTLRVTPTDDWNEHLKQINSWHRTGGEGRLAHWKVASDDPRDAALWNCPGGITTLLRSPSNNCIRMVLATPAIFRNGWRPGWLNDSLEGTPPIPGAPRLKLIGATVERWQPVSGWSLDRSGGKQPGAKPIRRMVPAGSVYFFEKTDDGDIQSLAQSGWLAPVSDEQQDRRDGFGLAIWGTW